MYSLLTRVHLETYPCGFSGGSDPRPRQIARRFWYCSSFYPAWPDDIRMAGRDQENVDGQCREKLQCVANTLSPLSPCAQEGWESRNSWSFLSCFFPPTSLSPDFLGDGWLQGHAASQLWVVELQRLVQTLSWAGTQCWEEKEEGFSKKNLDPDSCPVLSPVWPGTNVWSSLISVSSGVTGRIQSVLSCPWHNP